MNRSLANPAEPHEGPSGRSSRLRFELMYAAVLLAFGLFVLPALIYSVGVTLLGPYGAESGGEAGWGRFYSDFFADLANPSIRAWAIASGPLLLITTIRGAFLGVGRRKTADPASPGASGGRRQAASSPADPQAAQAQPRRAPRLDPPLDAGSRADDPGPSRTDTVIAAEPRRPGASPQQRPGRIEPRIGSD
jgi:hypothetical protein